MKYVDEYKNPDAAQAIAKNIRSLSGNLNRPFNIMEVCGSHTMAIARYGIRDLLPENISLISGPGCPVCVTDSGYIDTAIELVKKNITVATFGDMINVPGTETTLSKLRSEGGCIEVCYSPLSMIDMAKQNPHNEYIFLAIGFETTIAPILGMLEIAIAESIKNISILTAFKLVPPALEALTTDPEIKIDSFLCPAHVSAIIGEKPYEQFVKKHKIPCVIASFEPVDILYGIQGILEQATEGVARVDNRYKRVVKPSGNELAQSLINKYLEPYSPAWRGIGVIPSSGLRLRTNYKDLNAEARFGLKIENGKVNTACKCGDVLKGKIKPNECPLFNKVCNPLNPVGPCMVSSEGSCAAYYKYMR